MERHYLRFVGKMWDTGEFEPGVGWETDRFTRRAPLSPDHRLRLLDKAGTVLIEAGVELRSGTCHIQGMPGMLSQRVVGYVPLHPAARTVELLRGESVVHRREVSSAPPRVAITSVEVGDRHVDVRWKAKHERDLRFNVVFVDAKRRSIPVARELSDNHLSVAIADLPGGPGCTLAVLATDGLRSAMVRSDAFDLPPKPARLMIQAPVDGEALAPDQPLSLVGCVHDWAGRPRSEKHLVWSIDSEVVARGQRLTLARPLEPGAHQVELTWERDGEPAVRCAVCFSVCQRSDAQEAWRALSTSHSGPCNRQ